MSEFTIYETLKEAYHSSTRNSNRFLEALNMVNWDETFRADGEHYFCKGNLIFTTPSLDPFAMNWKPSMMFADGSCVEL